MKSIRIGLPPRYITVAVITICTLCLSSQAVAQAVKISEPAIDALIADLKSPEPARRREAAKLLGNTKAQRATPYLVEAAGDPDPAMRREVAIALDKMLDIRSLPAFVKLSTDPDRVIRDRCIVGLVNLYLPQDSGLMATLSRVSNRFNPWSDEWSDVIIEPGLRADESAILALQNRLQDEEEAIRIKAARSLGILKGRSAVEAMLQALGRPQTNELRFEIIRSLRKIGDGSAAHNLMDYIEYRDSKVRNEAVHAVGRLRYREGVPVLLQLFEKESAQLPKLIDKSYREVLLDALAHIADPAAVQLFIQERKNPETALRIHAYEGLARIGDPAIITDVSREWLHEQDPLVKTAQAFALFRMGRREFLDVVGAALGNRGTNRQARMYMLELTATELPELYTQASNTDVDVREGLIEIIGLIGDQRAIPTLEAFIQDRRGQIPSLAAQAIRRINARMEGRQPLLLQPEAVQIAWRCPEN